MAISKHYLVRSISAFLALVVVLVAAVSTAWSPRSLADYNHNPIGVIDHCILSGSTTIIYGWAHDPDAPVGGYPQVQIKVGTATLTANTSVSGYHDAQINTYMKSVRAG